MHPKHTQSNLYILGDVDRVREHIDRELLASNLEAVTKFSTTLTRGLATLARASEELMGAEIIMVGGDDVLFRVGDRTYSKELLARIAKTFKEETDCTISFGVGTSVPVAYVNLRRAKAEGRGSICGDEVAL